MILILFDSPDMSWNSRGVTEFSLNKGGSHRNEEQQKVILLQKF